MIGSKDRRGAPLLTVLCQGCGLARVEPLPSREQLAAFYRERYRLEYKGVYEPRPYHVLRAGRLARERIQRLAPHLAGVSRVLDIGCGGGELLYLLRAAGRATAGIEPNLRYGAYARDQLGLDVHIGLIEDQQFPAGSFGGITLFHVLEHLPDPVHTLAHIRPWLLPQGFLAIEVPNFASTLEHPAHRFHRAHLFYFNAATLELCASRAGFSAIHLEASADGGNLYGLFRPGGEPAAPRRLPENYQRLLELERSRSAAQYWFRRTTYTRALRRLQRMLQERREARRYAGRRDILEALAQQTAGELSL
ncbi:MAG: class I SAM-dependent methyltransferase [Bryobacteraceae bacterium]|nr:class I SAM-dependent methyltransferase [Bryobacteraceae bacterium]